MVFERMVVVVVDDVFFMVFDGMVVKVDDVDEVAVVDTVFEGMVVKVDDVDEVVERLVVVEEAVVDIVVERVVVEVDVVERLVVVVMTFWNCTWTVAGFGVEGNRLSRNEIIPENKLLAERLVWPFVAA